MNERRKRGRPVKWRKGEARVTTVVISKAMHQRLLELRFRYAKNTSEIAEEAIALLYQTKREERKVSHPGEETWWYESSIADVPASSSSGASAKAVCEESVVPVKPAWKVVQELVQKIIATAMKKEKERKIKQGKERKE